MDDLAVTFRGTQTKEELYKAGQKEFNTMIESRRGMVTTFDLQEIQQSIKEEIRSGQLEMKYALEEIKEAWMKMEIRLNTQADLVTLMKDMSQNLINIKVFQTAVKSQNIPANLISVPGDDQDQIFQLLGKYAENISRCGASSWSEENEENLAFGKVTTVILIIPKT